jgi:hypothetical protein
MDEIRPAFSNVTDGGSVFQSSVVRYAGPSIGSTIDALDNSLVSPGANKQLATPWYSDQVLPFDITLSGANEYGAMCAARIFGVEILNEGWGISIDDAVSEMQATFVARVVEPMSAVASPFLLKTRPFFRNSLSAIFRIRYGNPSKSCSMLLQYILLCPYSLWFTRVTVAEPLQPSFYHFKTAPPEKN